VLPKTEARPLDANTGSVPEGIDVDHPDGGVNVLLEKLNEPPLGVLGVVVDLLKIDSTAVDVPLVPSTPFTPLRTSSCGLDHVRDESVPVGPDTLAVVVDTYTGSDPDGIVTDQPVGAVAELLVKSYDPPVGVLGEVVDLLNMLNW
jgi:hypothetical protein